MMDRQNLKVASLYLNNQLLSRGLLRLGQSVDFVNLDHEDDTQAHIMRVVNDLILRLDHDAAQRDSISDTIRMLQAERMKLSIQLNKLKEEKSSVIRKLVSSEAEKKTLEIKLKTSGAKEKALKVEVEKLKSAASQVRAMCAVDCRKRDRTMENLKKAISESGRIRGAKNNGVREIIVLAGIGEDQKNPPTISAEAEGYNLRNETNGFLTELAQSLSQDNENLGNLLRRTLNSLKKLSGWESIHQTIRPFFDLELTELANEMDAVIEHVKTLLTNPNYVPLEEVQMREEEIIRLREGWEHMEQRWKDAVQMIDGWRKKMICGNETLNLENLKMNLNLDSLIPQRDESQCLKLSVVQEESECEDNDSHVPISYDILNILEENTENESNEEKMESDSSIFEEYVFDECPSKDDGDIEYLEEEQYVTHDSSSILSYQKSQPSPLSERAFNEWTAEIVSPKRKPNIFSSTRGENTLDLLQLDLSPVKIKTDQRPRSKSSPLETVSSPNKFNRIHLSGTNHTQTPTSSSINKTGALAPSGSSELNHRSITSISWPQSRPTCSLSPQRPTSTSRSHFSYKSPTMPYFSTSKSVSTARLKSETDCRLPRPRDDLPHQSPLTMSSIAAKLAASEREADAARVRAKIKAARTRKNVINVDNKLCSSKLKDQSKKLRQTSTVNLKLISPEKIDNLTSLNDDESRQTNIENGLDNETIDQNSLDTHMNVQQGQNLKRKAKKIDRKIGSKTRRRRSTLSSWELEKLIGGDFESVGREDKKLASPLRTKITL